MPSICMFYGIIIRMYYLDDGKRHQPHFHAEYGGRGAVIAIKTGAVLSGSLPAGKLKLVQAWAELRREDLERVWGNLTNGKKPGRITPLK